MSQQHIVSSYESELEQLTSTISEMGGLVENAAESSVKALTSSDSVLASKIIEQDKRVDAMQKQIDESAVSIIARRQPMAEDLRQVIAAVRICNDLERVGDMAKNIARRTLAIDGQRISDKLFTGLRHTAALALSQLSKSLTAYTSQDVELAVDVCVHDEDVDAHYVSLFRELLTYMMEDARHITHCTHLLFCAKNLERVGDHATNIAEAIYYQKTGEILMVENRTSATVAGVKSDTIN